VHTVPQNDEQLLQQDAPFVVKLRAQDLVRKGTLPILRELAQCLQ
jgi:hypothetical protein